MSRIKDLEFEILVLKTRIAVLSDDLHLVKEKKKDPWDIKGAFEEIREKQLRTLAEEVMSLKDILEKAGIIEEAKNVVQLKDNHGKPVLNTVNRVFITESNEDDFFDGCDC